MKNLILTVFFFLVKLCFITAPIRLPKSLPRDFLTNYDTLALTSKDFFFFFIVTC